MYGRNVEIETEYGVLNVFVFCVPSTSEKELKEQALKQFNNALSNANIIIN